ncbi:MAG: hypothetical protein GF393_01940, partial [Armatimonadia bacterium]|nr:hypothetical protein [Armatimonadia bacterium]
MRKPAALLTLTLIVSSPALAQEALRLDFSPPAIERVLERAEGRSATLEVPRCTRAPSVQGGVSEAQWQSAAEFTIPRGGEATPATRALICYDEYALYVAAICDLALGTAPVAEEHPRDDGAWRDDCIELWIDTAGSGEAVYQFIISAGGAIYDQGPGGPDYNPEWRHGAHVGDDGWSVAFAIPLTALELDRWQPTLGFNIGRNGPDIDPRAFAGSYADTGA